ncbi:MAG: hypothetical protein C4K48_06835 [Candidatus Thorarchaeota archaeon]|nr:MAG: hypothetical protein C4K48_06835 [Candidatus Thorarchaeota archaeon]
MQTARAIGSIILTSVGGGSRLLAKTWWALRKGRGEVRKSARTFYETLREAGIPEEDARAIAVAYAQPAYDILRFRSLIKMAMEMNESDSSPSFST